MIKKIPLLLFILALTIGQLFWVFPASAASSSTVLVSEVKLGGSITGQPTEFIELYNNTDTAVNFDAGSWWLEYAKPAAVISDCSITSWAGVDTSSNVREQKVTGIIAAHGYATVAMNLNDSVGGSLRLQHNGLIDDLVGWSSVSSLAPCTAGSPAVAPPNGKSIQRKAFDGNNATDFTEPRDPTPLAPAAVTNPTPEPEPTPEPTPQCQGVSLSEIVPNPTGNDTGTEFIELFNEMAQPVDLTECTLKVGSATLALSGFIDPGYKSFYGLSLPNAAGGQVSLVTSSGAVNVTYPADLGDDESYSFINGMWQQGALSTPGEPNAMPPVAGETTATGETLVACAPGKYRSPETNRCRTIEGESSLAPCDPGQTRNPDTNRCRNSASVAGTLAPCDEGQSRNPETNRCRKNATSETAAAACPTGQERNPETNRCKKVLTAKSTNPMATTSDASKKPISYYVLGIVAVAAAAYGIFEYRHSLRNFFASRWQKA